jgi:uncharacterized coiled-coil protein SlyX
MKNLKRLIAARKLNNSKGQTLEVAMVGKDVGFEVGGEMFSIIDILVEIDKKMNSDKLWNIVSVALTIIAITLSAVFGVYAVAYKASIASFEARVILQKEIMVEYKDTIDKQNKAIDKQNDAINKQNDTINRQNDAITNLRIDIEVLKAK